MRQLARPHLQDLLVEEMSQRKSMREKRAGERSEMLGICRITLVSRLKQTISTIELGLNNCKILVYSAQNSHFFWFSHAD